MGNCLEPSNATERKNIKRAKSEVASSSSPQAISSANNSNDYDKFEDDPTAGPVTPIASDDKIIDADIANQISNMEEAYSPRLQQVAQMIDLNTTIPEDEETEAVALENVIVDHDDEKDESSESLDLETADKLNKQLTLYEITEDMEAHIDELIEDKIDELRKEEKYVMLQATVSTKAGMKNSKTKTNQDSSICLQQFGPSNILQFYGVLDGHGPSGHNVSQYCAEHLPKILVKDKRRILTTLSKPAYALIVSFEELEKQLDSEKESGKLKFDLTASGTTISCGLRVGNNLYLANLGDSRAVMGNIDSGYSNTKVRTKKLTTDHDPKNENEEERINQSRKGSLVVEDDGTSRIEVKLVDDKHSKPRPSLIQLKKTYGVDALQRLEAVSASVSRSIGDKLAHKYAGVISEPDVIMHKLNGNDLFVMWASDGIWTVIDNDDVTRIIGNKLKVVTKSKHYEDLQKINDKIVREAHIVWQDEFDEYVDDITAVITRIGTKKLNDL